MTPPTTPPVLLTRYSCFAVSILDGTLVEHSVDPDGDWVRAEDALVLSQALDQARKERDGLSRFCSEAQATWMRDLQRAESAEAENARLQEEREKLRSALVGLIGMDGREELDALEAAMRLMPAPAADKAASIDAIRALMATLPKAALVTEEGRNER